MRNTNTPIAAEGYPFIVGAAFITVVLAALGSKIPALLFLALLFGALTLFIVFFFRNPERTTSADENAVIAPADGVVIYLGPSREEHLGEEMTKISIFMSVFNVHVNRVPITGKVLDTFYIKGKFLDVRDERATFENEQSGLIIETVKGMKMVVVQVAGLIARRIVCYAAKGDQLVRGRRYGLIRFGSRLDVYLPRETVVRVRMGDKTVAGETILGLLP
ncbi:phosphatidylserine decarboxylase family protein [Geobacter hydrogenophilus]|uniref:Phosphatidylserine decarboxylase proenzyme n=1 Tax=Geobacter hydrogenophilus TaxID=40983 RepID=A0A9W6FXQ6_9BACT|nr:phosphatidylserine decarboxylase family protein [Geobacter hydrogenophilus]MBT0894867.1 phosphatidylserine decarboxylase family protein [Geobacter hydrogenophilus]GLI36728.1 phosphatidylserine decarboxylase proenzyme [Geobacter hydrogenophilus]